VFVNPAVRSSRSSRAGSLGSTEVALPDEIDTLTVVFAHDGADATSAVTALSVLSDALRLEGLDIDQRTRRTAELAGLHPTRSGLVRDVRTGMAVGVVGEVDPELGGKLSSALEGRRIGVLSLDVGRIADNSKTTRKSDLAQAVSRFPSSVFDLAFVAPDDVVAADIGKALVAAAGELVESVALFDVYRGTGVDSGSRSLAYRIKLSAEDHTLSEDEISAVRETCIAKAGELGARLR
jgi:phenylalanyl-tRNA synthetase beta chain